MIKSSAENIVRLYRSAVAVAMFALAVGCSDDFAPSTASGGAITFDAPIFRDEVAATTRGAMVSKFVAGDSFGVYAYRVEDEEVGLTAFMANQEVVLGNDGEWSYEPTQHWVREIEHDFYAYAPYVSATTTLSYNETTNKPQLTYTPSTDVSSQADLLFAEPALDLKLEDEKVGFTFNHALTAISFEAKCFDTSVTGKLYKIELTGINTSATADIDGTAIVWTYPETPTTADYTAAITFDIDETVTNEDTDETVTTYKTYRTITSTTATTDLTPSNNVLLLLPQTLPTDARLVVTLSVNGVDGTDDQVKMSFSFPEDTAWSAKNKYTYTINLGTEITVTYTVQEWSDATVSDDTIGTLIFEGEIKSDDEDWDGTTDTDQNIGDLLVDSDNIDSDSNIDTDWVEQEDVDNTSGGEIDNKSLTTEDNQWSDNTTTNDDSIGDTSIDDTVDSSVQNDWDDTYTDSATIGETTTED